MLVSIYPSYNSAIILSKMFTYYSQNYAGIIGAGLSIMSAQITLSWIFINIFNCKGIVL